MAHVCVHAPAVRDVAGRWASKSSSTSSSRSSCASPTAVAPPWPALSSGEGPPLCSSRSARHSLSRPRATSPPPTSGSPSTSSPPASGSSRQAPSYTSGRRRAQRRRFAAASSSVSCVAPLPPVGTCLPTLPWGGSAPLPALTPRRLAWSSHQTQRGRRCRRTPLCTPVVVPGRECWGGIHVAKNRSEGSNKASSNLVNCRTLFEI